VWPFFLPQLFFGDGLDELINGVKWPAFLQQLSSGQTFDQSIDEVVWPAFLQRVVWELFQITGVRSPTVCANP